MSDPAVLSLGCVLGVGMVVLFYLSVGVFCFAFGIALGAFLVGMTW